MTVIGEISSTVDVIIEWKIANFFSLSMDAPSTDSFSSLFFRMAGFWSQTEKDGDFYWSPHFCFGGERWYLGIYPNGSSERDSSGYVDLYLCKYSSNSSIRQAFSLSLKTVKGRNEHEKRCTKDFEISGGSHEFLRFIPRSELSRRRTELVPDNVLTIVCIMKSTTSSGSTNEVKELTTEELNKADTPEVTGSVEASGCATKTKKLVSFINQPKEHDWVTDFSDFFKEGKGVDVTFELETPSGKTEFMAHQLILALRSPYFADAFYGAERNNGHLRISLKGIDPKAFEQMIRYCYDCKPCLRTTKDACALLKVAFDFKVMNLQTQCRTFIKDAKIDPKNVFSVLEVSEQIEDKSLGDMCYTILQEKTRESMAAYELCDVTPAMVHSILYLQILSLSSEYELIKWIIDWAKVMSEDGDSTSENAREYLERLLKDMNFLALSMEEFALLCKENPQFFSSDEIASIFLNIAYPGTREMPGWYDNDVKCRVYTGSKE